MGVDKSFLKHVSEALSHAGTILVTGPASAKKELATYLEQEQPGLFARVAGIETVDHPTDGQLVAFARKYFKIEDKMQSQVRRGVPQ